MDADVSHEGASTGLVSASAQDSAFLSLPPEIRYQVYDHFIPTKVNKITPGTPPEPVIAMAGVCQQIRCEVYGLIAAVTTFHTDAGIFKDSTLKPYSTATKIRRMNYHLALYASFLPRTMSTKDKNIAYHQRMIVHLKDDIKVPEVPYQFNFWKVCVSIFNTYRTVKLIANINFKKQEVCVCKPDTAHGDSHDWDPSDSIKKAFINVMQEFTKKEGFRGVTIQDVSRFLEQVVMPNPDGLWAIYEKFELLKEAGDYEQDGDISSALT